MFQPQTPIEVPAPFPNEPGVASIKALLELTEPRMPYDFGADLVSEGLVGSAVPLEHACLVNQIELVDA